MMNRRFIGPVNRALRFSHILAKMSFTPYLFRIATYSSRLLQGWAGRRSGGEYFHTIAVCAVRAGGAVETYSAGLAVVYLAKLSHPFTRSRLPLGPPFLATARRRSSAVRRVQLRFTGGAGSPG